MPTDVRRIIEALERWEMQNHRPAVDEPANEFEKIVNEHADLQALIAEVKAVLKPTETAERKLRDGIADSLRAFYGDSIKEGVNNYELSNARTLKFDNKIKREIDVAHVTNAREAFDTADDVPAGTTFDSLLRVKYELNKTPWKKLGPNATHAFSRCMVTKHEAPGVKVD